MDFNDVHELYHFWDSDIPVTGNVSRDIHVAARQKQLFAQPVYRSGQELRGIIDSIIYSIKDSERASEAESIYLDALNMINHLKLGILSYDWLVKMENAALARHFARLLFDELTTMRKIYKVNDMYMKIYTDELANFKIEYRSWLATFKDAAPTDHEDTDEWGLFR